MPARNKFVLIAFFVTLITFLVAVFMYFRTQNEITPSNEPVTKQGPEPNYNPSVQVIDNHPTVNITLTDEEGIVKILGLSGVWENGIRSSFPNSEIAYPQVLIFEITDKEQIGLKRIEDKTNEESLTLSKSLLVVSENADETKIVAHFNAGYITRLGEENAKKAVVNDILYYTYILAGDRFGRFDYRNQLRPLADDYVSENIERTQNFFRFEYENER